MGSSLLSFVMRGQLVLTGAVNNVTVKESQSSLLLLLLALLQTIFAGTYIFFSMTNYY